MTPAFPLDLTPRQQRQHKADRRIVQQRYEQERRRENRREAADWANAFGTALSSAAPIEPAPQSRPYGLQSHFAKEPR